jgi:hypothetical protein
VSIGEDAVETRLDSAAPLRRLDVYRWLGTGSEHAVTAPSMGRLTSAVFSGAVVAGDIASVDVDTFSNATLTSSGSLGRLQGVTAGNSLFSVGGDIGRVTFGYFTGTRIYAGVRPLPPEAPAPASAADFVHPSTIGRFWLGDTQNSVVTVAASSVKRAIFRSMDPSFHYPEVVMAADQIDDVAIQRVSLGRRSGVLRIARLTAEVRNVGTIELRAL